MAKDRQTITIRLVHNVPVNLPSRKYVISIAPGLLARVGPELRLLTKSAKAAIVTDSHVEGLHLSALDNSLRSAGFETITATVPAGEQHKTMAMLLPLYDRFLAAKIERSTPIAGESPRKVVRTISP